MTVKDIFALRKQGKIEEAYEAIRPIYKEHKGKFTTLCMFWVASDVFKLRLEQNRVEEAEKIFRAMLRLLPFIEDDDKAASKREQSDACIGSVECEQARPEVKHSAAGFMHYAEGRLIKASEKFRKRYFAIKAASKREQSDACISSAEREQARPQVKRKTATAVSSSSVLASSAGEAGSPVDSAATIPAGSPAGLALSGSPAESLNKGQQAVLDSIREHPGLRVPGLEAETGIPVKSIERHIKVLIERNLIEHQGSKKTGGYHPL